MYHNQVAKQYEFRGPSEENGYLVFPDVLENDDHTFFHGTAGINLASIQENGFRITGNLASVSFARTSALPLRYACEARCQSSPRGVVIAARFDCLNRPGLVQEGSLLYVYKFEVQPCIVGYCIVPAEYLYH